MITRTDIRMLRSEINNNLVIGCDMIRLGRLELALEYITYADGVAMAMYVCDGGPRHWASVNRVRKLYYKARTAEQGY